MATVSKPAASQNRGFGGGASASGHPIGVLWSTGNNSNNNNNNSNNSLAASVSPPPALGAFTLATAPQRPSPQPQQHGSIWATTAIAARQPQQAQQQPQATSYIAAAPQVLNARRAFSPPASTATTNGVSLLAPTVVPSVIQSRSVISGNSGATTTAGVILQPTPRLVEVKPVPIQLVSARPAAPAAATAPTFLTLPAATKVDIGSGWLHSLYDPMPVNSRCYPVSVI